MQKLGLGVPVAPVARLADTPEHGMKDLGVEECSSEFLGRTMADG
jgi:hypothetical protein